MNFRTLAQSNQMLISQIMNRDQAPTNGYLTSLQAGMPTSNQFLNTPDK